MKLLSLFIFCLGLFVQSGFSQDSLIQSPGVDSNLKPVTRMTYIYPFHHRYEKGYLVTISDSAIFITQNKVPVDLRITKTTPYEGFYYHDIQKIKIIKPHAKSKAGLIGLGIGIVVGAIVGYSLGGDEGWFALDAGGKAVVGGLIGGGAGVLIGASIGSESDKKFLIDGDWKNLQEVKEYLKQDPSIPR